MRPTSKKPAGVRTAGPKGTTRIQVSCSEEEAALLRQLAGGWGVTPPAALRRLIREEAARQRLGAGRAGLAPAAAPAAPARRGEGWVATLGYEVPPIWDAMQSHLSVLTERLREQWPGFSEGLTHPATDRTHVYFEFTLPDGTGSAADLSSWIADEWAQIARDAGPVEVEDAPTWSARHGDRAA